MTNMERRQIVNEIHASARKNFPRRRVIMKGIDDLWQADLVEMGNYSTINKGYRYMLTVIDTFSKYAWAEAIKSKNAVEVSKAFKNILGMGRVPKNLQTDDGKEFFNKEFTSLMQKFSINHYSTYSIMKASIVERFNRTLKSLMFREFSYNGTYHWINMYKQLVKRYNETKHRTIKMAPMDVNSKNEDYLLKTVYNRLKIFKQHKFHVGDYVRISKYKHLFEKGYTPNFSTEVFRIKSIQITNPVTYILEDYQGNPIKGGFYEEEIQATKFPNTYLVEKILKTKGDKVYVKWLGFSSQHNSWINKNEIL